MSKVALRVWHNAKCSKSRAAISYLDDKKIPYDIVDYLSPGAIDKRSVISVLNKLNMKPIEAMRSGEVEYKEHIKDTDLPNDRLIDLIITYPILLERPIVESEESAVIVRPTTDILQTFLAKEDT